jgi:hypothetical protein
MTRKIAVILLLLVLPAATPAETLVLLQGYLGDEDYWREAGITNLLDRNGWPAQFRRSGGAGLESGHEPRSCTQG